MGKLTTGSNRSLPDGTPLHNRLLAALPVADYDRVLKHLRMRTVAVGDTLQAHGTRITDVYFPNGSVFWSPIRCWMVASSRSPQLATRDAGNSASSSATAPPSAARSSRFPMVCSHR